MQAEDIIKLIPVGRYNAISRKMLCMLAGCSDRDMRRLIHEARRDTAIINLSDGSGYYRPDLNDREDVAALERYEKQEVNRLRSIGWSLMGVRKTLRRAVHE